MTCDFSGIHTDSGLGSSLLRAGSLDLLGVGTSEDAAFPLGSMLGPGSLLRMGILGANGTESLDTVFVFAGDTFVSFILLSIEFQYVSTYLSSTSENYLEIKLVPFQQQNY